MMEMANTTLSVLRGTTVNFYGDKTNVGNPLYPNHHVRRPC
jgi:hypothetical protein